MKVECYVPEIEDGIPVPVRTKHGCVCSWRQSGLSSNQGTLRMTVTIELSDEQAAALQEQAAVEGLSVAVWLQRLAEQYAQTRASKTNGDPVRPIWDTITDRMKELPPEVFDRLPHDGASEHDHYLYGSPKRNE